MASKTAMQRLEEGLDALNVPAKTPEPTGFTAQELKHLSAFDRLRIAYGVAPDEAAALKSRAARAVCASKAIDPTASQPAPAGPSTKDAFDRLHHGLHSPRSLTI